MSYYSEEEKARTKAINEVHDHPRAIVKIEVHMRNAVLQRYQTLSAERIFVSDHVLPAEDVLGAGTRLATLAAIDGLRAMALKMERDLRETYLHG